MSVAIMLNAKWHTTQHHMLKTNLISELLCFAAVDKRMFVRGGKVTYAL